MRSRYAWTAGLGLWLLGLILAPHDASVAPRASVHHALGRRYEMLAADLHVHSFPGDGSLLPWDVASEARRQGLDAVALTNHNHMLEWRLARLLPSRMPGDVIVLAGEEITSPGFHLAAIGIDRPVGWSRSPGEVIDAVHTAGGVAIAAHPSKPYSGEVYDSDALRKLDGVEAAPPFRRADEKRRQDVEAFYARARAAHGSIAAIGSSDFHREAPLGLDRTFVFVTARTPSAIVEAIRLGRTAACNGGGELTGSAPWTTLAAQACRASMARARLSAARRGGALNGLAVCCALGGLAVMIFSRPTRR